MTGGWNGAGARRPLTVVGVGLAVIALALGCARTVAPTGGDVPETPLRVMATTPDTFQILDPFDGPIRFEFERRISERPSTGSLRDAVVVSPRTGEVEVRQRRRGIEVRMEGGFQERTVYRVTLLPTVQDLFRNTLARPYELFFSTGPDFEPNLVAGLLVDRLTGEPVPQARVEARPFPSGPVHSTVSDSLGIFSFRYIPAGAYRVMAWEDLNRNREVDFQEPQDSIQVQFQRGDTLVVTELTLLAPDTTAAVLTAALPLDSMAVEAALDDHLDPEESLAGVQARLEREGGPGIAVREVLHLWEWEEREAERAAARAETPPEPEEDAPDPDDPEPDPDPAPDPVEEAPAPAPVEEAPAPAPPETETQEEDAGPPLPAQEIVLVLAEALEPGATYTVVVEGITNLHGIPGGGGEVEMEVPEPEPEPEPEPDEEEDDEEPGVDPPDPPPPDTAGPPAMEPR